MRLLIALAVLSVSGCASTAALEDGPTRAADGLLERTDLQEIVDLQVRRDGPGLVELLSSPDSVVRARSAVALGSVQDPA
ncbi:hypothetical protein, partial [Rubrivirga sp.]|uniref:hypothetical protein n=1 Tax=Rubrivirga sp. TaxID=1885344 RepID=UPI003C787B2F